MPDTWPMIEWERRRLAAELDALTDEQWSTPTRCGDWRVREVVAHLSGLPGPVAALIGLVVNRGDVDAFIDKSARTRGAQPPAQLLADLRAWVTSRRVPPGVPPSGPLLELLVHGDDIRRAVGTTIDDRPDEHLRTALDFAVRSKSVFRGASRSKGVALDATDIDWRHGAGPLVEGPALSLLAAVLGRTDVLDELAGDGVAVLASRS